MEGLYWVIKMNLIKSQESLQVNEGSKRVRVRGIIEDAMLLTLKVEEGTVHQEMEAEAEKGKETDSPLEVPEK